MARALPASSRAARALAMAEFRPSASGWGTRPFGRQPGAGHGDGGGHFGEEPFRLAADRGLLARGELGGGLRALAAFERLAEREAVVALPDGVLRALQRVDSRRVVLCGIAVGAGGAGGVDGALRLMKFLVWRIAASAGSETTGRQSVPGRRRRGIAPEYTQGRSLWQHPSSADTSEDRPREKLTRVGVAGLGDNELLALVLGTARRRRARSGWPTCCWHAPAARAGC